MSVWSRAVASETSASVRSFADDATIGTQNVAADLAVGDIQSAITITEEFTTLSNQKPNVQKRFAWLTTRRGRKALASVQLLGNHFCNMHMPKILDVKLCTMVLPALLSCVPGFRKLGKLPCVSVVLRYDWMKRHAWLQGLHAALPRMVLKHAQLEMVCCLACAVQLFWLCGAFIGSFAPLMPSCCFSRSHTPLIHIPGSNISELLGPPTLFVQSRCCKCLGKVVEQSVPENCPPLRSRYSVVEACV